MFALHGASRVQTLRYLKLPAALPFILSGLRIAGGLALIGALRRWHESAVIAER